MTEVLDASDRSVTPAQAGAQGRARPSPWMPAFAGITEKRAAPTLPSITPVRPATYHYFCGAAEIASSLMVHGFFRDAFAARIFATWGAVTALDLLPKWLRR